MSEPIFGGLLKIEISGPEEGTLRFWGVRDGVARFSVVEVENITILDSRQHTVENIQELLASGRIKRALRTLNAPAFAEIDREESQVEIRLEDVEPGITEEDTVYKLRIAVKHPGHVPTAKFLMFKGGSHSRQTISYAALFRYT